MSFKNVTRSNVNEICDLFADFFEGVYRNEHTKHNLHLSSKHADLIDIGNITLTEEEVRKGLSSINSKKSCGPDLVPPIVLKSCAQSLTTPLCYLFNTSLKVFEFPSLWKFSTISVIFKSGLRRQVDNYRGVAILPALSKVFETVVCRILSDKLRKTISDFQHGFMRGRSICTNLLSFTSDVINTIESGKQVDVIYTDFSKAFDRVQHSVLIKKLRHLGIHSSMLKWIESYLSNRTQQVKILGCSYRTFMAKSGIPQGSILGPLLFILFINDVVDVFHYVKCLLFADDLKLYMPIASAEDVCKLQADINRLTEWCSSNLLYLNVNKCTTSSYYRTRKPITADYFIGKEKLTRKTVIKDL